MRFATPILLVVFALTPSTLVLAQSNPGAAPLTITIAPAYPRPYDTVSVTPSSNLIDLSASKITFYVNGKQVGQGSGTESRDIAIGGPGVTTTIRVTATLQGKTYESILVVHPTDIALIAEPVSTTHPFYAGGNLIASEGHVRLIALADIRTSAGSRIASQNLVYTWRLGQQLLEPQSGIGRSTLTLGAPIRYRDTSITVTVGTQDGSSAGQATVAIAPIDPLVRLYAFNPLLGPDFNIAIGGSYAMRGKEDTLLAVPYFFPAKPALEWKLNGDNAGTDSSLTVRTTSSGAGTASIDVSASGSTSFSVAQTATNISFGQSNSSSSFFGL